MLRLYGCAARGKTITIGSVNLDTPTVSYDIGLVRGLPARYFRVSQASTHSRDTHSPLHRLKSAAMRWRDESHSSVCVLSLCPNVTAGAARVQVSVWQADHNVLSSLNYADFRLA